VSLGGLGPSPTSARSHHIFQQIIVRFWSNGKEMFKNVMAATFWSHSWHILEHSDNVSKMFPCNIFSLYTVTINILDWLRVIGNDLDRNAVRFGVIGCPVTARFRAADGVQVGHAG
jgi:hypothetical protein